MDGETIINIISSIRHLEGVYFYVPVTNLSPEVHSAAVIFEIHFVFYFVIIIIISSS